MVKDFFLVLLKITIVFAFLRPISGVGKIKNFWQKKAVFQQIDLCAQPYYSQILPGLYLSNARAACDLTVLHRLNITHILTIEGRKLPKYVYDLANVTTLYINAADSSTTNIMRYFPICNEFIAKGINDGNVLVHCHVGVSRSAAIVIAYLMERYKLSYEEAHEYVRLRRRFINPNPGFVSQLKEYERLNYKVGGLNKLEMFGKRNKYKLLSAAAVAVGLLVPLILLVFKGS